MSTEERQDAGGEITGGVDSCSPASAEHPYRLSDLIDLAAVQKMADSHFQATGIPIGLIDTADNAPLVGAGWQDICVHFHRNHPQTLQRCLESDAFVQAGFHRTSPCSYKCLNGLWNVGMPVIVAGKHLATLFLGQFFYEGEVPDRELFIKQANQYDFDQKTYLEALERVPVFTKEKVQTIIDYDIALTGFIAALAETALRHKQAETERAALELRLQQVEKMNAIGQLVGGIAHDFNNMLGGIVGAAEMLQVYLPDDQKAQKFHRLILDTADRAAELIGKLLTLSRRTPPKNSLVDMHQVIRETIVLLENTVDPRISLETRLDAQQTIVIGDQSQLQNVFLNLGINSAHAMPDGGSIVVSSANVTLDAATCQDSPFELQPGQFLEMVVRDTGAGIAPEVVHKIFDPFFTTKEQKGTGLGLATVFATVQQHHGAITVSSLVGEGTTFTLHLPVADREHMAAMPSPLKDRSGIGKILLVDDEEIMRSTGKALLEELGFEVQLARDGKEAVSIFRRENTTIDLVILDMLMPVMNGRDTLLALQQIDPGVRVILSYGYITDEELQHMQENGLGGFIQKPYRRAALSRTIQEVLA